MEGISKTAEDLMQIRRGGKAYVINDKINLN
jgi:ribosomal protein L36